ncbi:NAD+ synthase [Candidatus Synechococcus calcipolaris G9]|uniref:Glutamine-dependent NAD(+) synthetase n=1 Tax=Candidatus Synechococcus calcipolaris G9 TaxID=1497997 RepID=A0ABT6EY51_9SYNE|nr:NAD+ synthase [Candidatus Synechococcus calcipolaris]MDG2990716.1 NAD+ synthase [Candidatus Synechococcus calcipolaris G9]
MNIAIAQINPIIGDLVGNSQKILEVAQGVVEPNRSPAVDLLITSELALCGYPPKDLLMDPHFIEAMDRQLEELTLNLPPSLTLLLGTVRKNKLAQDTGGKTLLNGAVLIQDQAIIQTFAKRLLPTYDVFDEDRYFEPGHTANHFELDLQGKSIKIGVTICEDLWNDEQFWGQRRYQINPVAELVQEQVDLIVNLSASPYSLGKPKLRQQLLAHTVQRYGCPIIYVNQVGGNDDLIFDGHSLAVNRPGEIVAQAAGFQEDILVVPWQQGDLQPSRKTPLAQSEQEEMWRALVLGVQDYAQKCGFRQAVIGLSGGIDSALVAAIATAALGPENVLGILMPSPHSSDHSITDALALAKNLGIQTHTLAIADLMKGYDRTLETLFLGTTPGVAEENIQARIRGTLLMAIANKFGHLLISTGNKSELAVGYCTLYGDMSGGLAAIADVPKTKVYALCHWLNAQAKHNPLNLAAFNLSQGPANIIPEHILTKPPSAELKPGQTDQDSLPDYDSLDDILEQMIDHHQADAAIVSRGHDPALVERIRSLVHRAEFKRQQAAPGLKITERAFGSGWRMPIAAKIRIQHQN